MTFTGCFKRFNFSLLVLLIFMFSNSPFSQAVPSKNILSNNTYDSSKIRTNVKKFTVGKKYQLKGRLYEPKINLGYKEYGLASWYGGSKFHGVKTASGVFYDQSTYTAAHRTLPMPSVIKVTNVSNNKSVILVVNDRGPVSKNRILDVSKEAAKALGFLRRGVAKVRIQYLHQETKELIDRDLPRLEAKRANEAFSIAMQKESSLP